MSTSIIKAIKQDDGMYLLILTEHQLNYMRKAVMSHNKELERAKEKYYKKRTTTGDLRSSGNTVERYVIITE